MKEKHRLNNLFEQARSQKPIVDLNDIEQVIRSGKRLPTQKLKLGKPGRGFFNPLKLIVMLSIVASIVSLVLVFTPVEVREETFVDRAQYEEVPVSDQVQNDSGIEQVGEGTFLEQVGGDNIVDEVGCKEIPEQVRDGKGADEDGGVPEQVRDDKGSNQVGEDNSLVGDTLFRGEVLYLTKEELTKLGFLFNENGFFYCNQDERGYMNFYSDKNPDDTLPGNSTGIGFNKIPRNLRKEITHFDFHVGTQTGLAGEKLKEFSLKTSSVWINSAAYWDDEAVPVYFPGVWFAEPNVNDRIIWFSVSDTFFDLLSSEKVSRAQERVALVKKLRAVPGNEKKNFVDFILPGYHEDRIRVIKLESSYMQKLGLRFNKQLTYRYRLGEGMLALTLANGGSQFRADTKPYPKDEGLTDSFNVPLLGVSRLSNGQSVAIANTYFSKISDSVEFFTNMYDVCLPVMFVGDDVPAIASEALFWFYPSSEFIYALPDSIGQVVNKEFSVNVEPQLMVESGFEISDFVATEIKKEKAKAVPCEYFPSFCEGLPGLDNLNVYPNPTSGELNVEVILNMAKNIDYRVFDLSGRLVIDEVPQKKYDSAGQHKEKIDLTHLENGFYLLVLTDEMGARMTKRVVKH